MKNGIAAMPKAGISSRNVNPALNVARRPVIRANLPVRVSRRSQVIVIKTPSKKRNADQQVSDNETLHKESAVPDQKRQQLMLIIRNKPAKYSNRSRDRQRKNQVSRPQRLNKNQRKQWLAEVLRLLQPQQL